mmetsp:Transcript_58691/g.132297  ORF Transcript_58691/g.132297 Transcript_58691/m.132297 type:complete len:254 (-) Transcript_58691:201-962(-)
MHFAQHDIHAVRVLGLIDGQDLELLIRQVATKGLRRDLVLLLRHAACHCRGHLQVTDPEGVIDQLTLGKHERPVCHEMVRVLHAELQRIHLVEVLDGPPPRGLVVDTLQQAKGKFLARIAHQRLYQSENPLPREHRSRGRLRLRYNLALEQEPLQEHVITVGVDLGFHIRPREDLDTIRRRHPPPRSPLVVKQPHIRHHVVDVHTVSQLEPLYALPCCLLCGRTSTALRCLQHAVDDGLDHVTVNDRLHHPLP